MRTHRRLEGEAHWEGRLACARATVTIRADVRPPARASVRFDDAIDPALRDGLELLRRRRGVFAARLADRLGEIEVGGRDASSGSEWRVVGRLQGAVARHAPRALAQTAFTVQVLSVIGPGFGSAGADEPTDEHVHPATPANGQR